MSNLMKTLTIGDASYEICDASAVKSVNGVIPDESGNVVVQAGVQPDWNQNDSTAADYVKNRTHYDAGTPKEFTIFSGESLEFFPEEHYQDPSITIYTYEIPENEIFDIIYGNTYLVTIDGTTYTTKAKDYYGVCIGNLSIDDLYDPDTGENFLIFPDFIILNTPGETHNISITEMKSVVEREIVSDNDYVFSVKAPDWPELINTDGFDFSNISNGDLLTVTFDGVEYTNVAKLTFYGVVFGNLGLFDTGESTGEPFLAIYENGISTMSIFIVQNQFSIDKVLTDGTYENIVANKEYVFELNGPLGRYFLIINEPEFIFEADTTYRVIWNGTEYTCSSTSEEITSGETTETAIYVGNIGKMMAPDDDTSDTGEPFVLAYSPSNGFMAQMFVDESFTSTHRIKIDGCVSGVKKLDKKYIPVASRIEAGIVKVCDVSYDISNDRNYCEIYLDSKDNKIYARKPYIPSVPTIRRSTTDLTEGVSSLATGEIYLVYE